MCPRIEEREEKRKVEEENPGFDSKHQITQELKGWGGAAGALDEESRDPVRMLTLAICEPLANSLPRRDVLFPRLQTKDNHQGLPPPDQGLPPA